MARLASLHLSRAQGKASFAERLADALAPSRSPQKPSRNVNLSEADVQSAIVEYLRAVLPLDYRVIAIPNASRRTVGGRASNAVAGLSPGYPDLQIVSRYGRVWPIEVKRPVGGRVSPDQSEWLGWFERAVVATSIDDVRAALENWNIPTKEAK